MDELQNFISAYEWNTPLAKDFVLFLGIISKLRQTYLLATPDPVMFPRGIKDPGADVYTALFYKDIEHTYDFNFLAGKHFTVKELIFLERHGCRKEVWKIGVCPWARPEATVKPGEFVYDHMVPGSRFSKGIVNGYEFDFRHVVEALEGRISEEIPDRLIQYVKRYSSLDTITASQIEAAQNVELPEITPDMSPRDRKKLEKEIIIPYLATFTKVNPSEVTDKGLLYSNPHIFSMWRRYLKETGKA